MRGVTAPQLHAGAKAARSAGKSTGFPPPPRTITEPLANEILGLLAKKDVPILLFEGAENKRLCKKYQREKGFSFFEISHDVLEQALTAFQHSSLSAADLLFSFSGTWKPMLVIKVRSVLLFCCTVVLSSAASN